MNKEEQRKVALRRIRGALDAVRHSPPDEQTASTNFGLALGFISLADSLCLIDMDERQRLSMLNLNAAHHARVTRYAMQEASHVA